MYDVRIYENGIIIKEGHLLTTDVPIYCVLPGVKISCKFLIYSLFLIRSVT